MWASGTWNLILTGLWLVIGVAVLVTDPPNLRFSYGGVSFSSGWAALLLASYNAVRWWGLRSALRRRRAAEEMERHRPPRRSGEPEPERNPDFVFDEPPPEKPA